ncbi:hypothetical protein F5148DRAFT_239638 [Russula earlei]|uniref:Uncharacterized protein n=1 Tax=Russula earlei TaxID=71964 RepID=A0ACC0TQ38_9AGAM|nr:hypothetical protein F5148DRAFT_239638 [Russula earlei]
MFTRSAVRFFFFLFLSFSLLFLPLLHVGVTRCVCPFRFCEFTLILSALSSSAPSSFHMQRCNPHTRYLNGKKRTFSRMRNFHALSCVCAFFFFFFFLSFHDLVVKRGQQPVLSSHMAAVRSFSPFISQPLP